MLKEAKNIIMGKDMYDGLESPMEKAINKLSENGEDISFLESVSKGIKGLWELITEWN